MPAMPQWIWYVIVLMIAAILIAIIFLTWGWIRKQFKKISGQYKLRLIIIEKRAHGYNIRYDYGLRVINKDGTEDLDTINSGKIRPIEYKYIAGDTLFLSCPDSKNYYPMVIDEEGIKLTPVDVDLKAYLAAETVKAVTDYEQKSWFREYGGLITIMATGILVIMILYVSLPSITGPFNEAAKVLVQAIEKQAATCNYEPAKTVVIDNVTVPW